MKKAAAAGCVLLVLSGPAGAQSLAVLPIEAPGAAVSLPVVALTPHPVPAVSLPPLAGEGGVGGMSLPALKGLPPPSSSPARGEEKRRAAALSALEAAVSPRSSARAAASQAPDLRLRAFFDHGLRANEPVEPGPTSAEILARAEAAGVPVARLGEEMRDAFSLGDVHRRWEALGVLKRAEHPLSTPQDELAFRYKLRTVWRSAAPGVALPFSTDDSRSVPAVIVRVGDAVFHIHGIAHGLILPMGAREVRALVAGLRAEGRALYSEQHIPGMYGFRHGKEFLDHLASSGGTAPVVAAGGSGFDSRPLAWMVRAAVVGGVLASAAAVLQAPASPAAWALAGLSAAAAYVVHRSFAPLFRLHHLRLARRAEKEVSSRPGLASDMAGFYRAQARVVFGRRIDPAAFLALELPPRLKEQDSVVRRSRAMADAALMEAASLALKEVHVLCGFNHVYDIAWRLAARADGVGPLARPGEPRVPEPSRPK